MIDDATGRPATREALTAAGVVTLPMTRAESGTVPPCGSCPKIPAGRAKAWENAAEFGPWLWDLLAMVDEAAACGEPMAGLDPLARAAAAEVSRWRADRRDRRRAGYVAAALYELLRK